MPKMQITDCCIRPVFKHSKMVMCYATVVLNDCIRISGFRAYPGKKRIFNPGGHGSDGLHYENVQFTGEEGQVMRKTIYRVIREALEQYFPGFTTAMDNPQWHEAGSYQVWKRSMVSGEQHGG